MGQHREKHDKESSNRHGYGNRYADGPEADTVLELLLTRLDEQGLEISSPWAVMGEECIVDALWPRIHNAWLEKERWNGCTEVLKAVRTEWVHWQAPALLEGFWETW